MKKVVMPASCIALSLALILQGCSGSAGSETSEGAQGQGTVEPVGTYPLVKEKQTLKVFTKQDVNVEDYETNEFTKWYENKTNVHVDWEIVPNAAIKEKIQVKLAGGDLPDVFMSSPITDSQMVGYGSQGLFLPLNDLIEQYAPNVKKMFEKAPYLKHYLNTPDGNIYSIPNVGETYHSTMPKKMWIYKPWLDKLGLQVPTTTEELYNVLMAFKTQDPNGNGKADEIPLSGADGTNNGHNEPESFVMQSFIFFDRANYLMLDNGTVEFAADKPAYKEGLKYIRRLVQDGLLQSDAFIQDRKALTALAEDPAGSRLGAATALYWGNLTIDNGPSGRYKEYVPVPILAGPDGQRIGFDRGYAVDNGHFVITKNAKNPPLAMRWIDWFFDEENKLQEGWSDYLGQEGIAWKKPDPGVKGLDGRPAKYQTIIPFGTKNNNRWAQTAPRFQHEDFRLSQAATPDAQTEIRLLEATKNLYKPYSAHEKYVPHLYFSDEDLARFGDLQKNITTVVQDFMLKFVTGTLDIENDWPKYTKELENAGLQQYLQIIRDNYAKLEK
ncbi:extracellular solute-binding protein [Paenibacillus xerothermodurans]|uniref:ABC transporter substrate-binding protein n=1 Tax=Paenibacillus xerothermodurans TaxID=1977292 RepID=A0A2W1P081_PAEXE|nr:extracellular solute-binding protein [Paenibacillus xerothermodurans]PZE21142.1 ABC transporter substrate-binding protein [Paenibacillus xerothermodurans]